MKEIKDLSTAQQMGAWLIGVLAWSAAVMLGAIPVPNDIVTGGAMFMGGGLLFACMFLVIASKLFNR